MRLLAIFGYRSHIVPQPKTVEFVIMKCRVRLRHQPIEIAVVCS